MSDLSTFKKEVNEGLSAYPKFLSSKYIYDEQGDKLFQEIMAMPEYYLTRSELANLKENASAIVDLFPSGENGLDIIELGAGDGTKTVELLKEVVNRNMDHSYIPIDISAHAIELLKKNLEKSLPAANVNGRQGTYTEVLAELHNFHDKPKVIIFLGSNIGNLPHKQAIKFLRTIADNMQDEDLLFMGFDLKKDPIKIQQAYADQAGITQRFNRNLLKRINRELEADFPVEKFDHWEAYDPESGTARSFLIATQECRVEIRKLGKTFEFDRWETIHTEISQKYDHRTIEWLADESTLDIKAHYIDSEDNFANYIFKSRP